MPTMAPKGSGLIPVPKEVSRAGKTFTQNYWMKPEEAAKKLKDKGFEPNKAGKHVAEFKSLVDEFAGFKGAGQLAAAVTTSWTGSCKNKEAAEAQGVVAILLGRDPKQTPHVQRGDSNAASLLAAAAKAKDASDPLRKALIGCYAVTQAALKLAGEPEMMKLTRGVKGAQAAELVAAAKALADAGVHYDDAALSTGFNPLSCFTTNHGVSYQGFGSGSSGVTFSMDVPREAVMFSHKSTPGHSTTYGPDGNDEQEYTVMCAGPMDLALRNVHGAAGKQIYDYFAEKGLTGNQTPKAAVGGVAAPVKIDPEISFKVQGSLSELKMKQAVENAGGTWLGGTGQNAQIKASEVSAFVDAFKETPAFDAKVKSPEAMKTWLQQKATNAISAATPGPTGSGYANASSWKAAEPETKEVAERIAKALGAGSGVSAALKEKAAQVGAAAFKAADPDEDDEASMDYQEELIEKMNDLIPTNAELFGKPGSLMSTEEHALLDDANAKSMEALMESESPEKAAKAFVDHVKKNLPGLTAPKTELPKMDKLTHAGKANIGGAGEKHFYTDADGKKFLVKLANEKGTGKDAPVKVAAQVLSAAVGQAIKPGVSIPIAPGEHKGIAATVQPWLGDNLPNLKGTPPESLSSSQMKDVAEEHVIDWLTGQHDSHGGNLVKLPSGKIVGVDKEQALKHVHDDKLDVNYHPNAEAGEAPPYYNGFWKGFASGTVDFDPTVLKGAIEKAEAIPEAVHKAKLAEYAKLQKPGSVAAQQKIVDAAMERKKNIRADFEKFITGHYEKLEGQKGAFTFNGGWKPHSEAPTPSKTSGEAMAELYSKTSSSSGAGAGKLAGDYKPPAWAKPSDEKFNLGQVNAFAAHALLQEGHGTYDAKNDVHVPPKELHKAVKAMLEKAHEAGYASTTKDAYSVAKHVISEHLKAPAISPSPDTFEPEDVEGASPPKALVGFSDPANFDEGHKLAGGVGGLENHAENWAQHHLNQEWGDLDDDVVSKATQMTAAHFKSKAASAPTMKEAHEEFKKQLDIATGKPAGATKQVPDVDDAKVQAFFKENAGKSPPHRKWYWEGWAQSAMNKAGIPKEQHKEIFEKVQAQAKVMLAKHAITGQKVSQDAAKAYIQAQAIKKGANPDEMPHVVPSLHGDKPKLEKKTHAEAKELHAYFKKKVAGGNATPEEEAAAAVDPENVHALKKAMTSIGYAVDAPPKPKAAGPEHPYEYYWKTWANKAAKAETGKPASPEVHAKISGLAKKFIAQKTLAGSKFTGLDLEKYIQAAAKKKGEHPGDI